VVLLSKKVLVESAISMIAKSEVGKLTEAFM
jgi:hypothetical protein